MTAQPLPQPDFAKPATDGRGFLTGWFKAWVQAMDARAGARFDKIDEAHATALAAAPQSTQVVAGGGLQIGGALTGNVGLALYAAIAPLASLPTTGLSEGDIAYALDGRKSGEGAGAGSGTPCWWSVVSGTGGWYAFGSGALVTT